MADHIARKSSKSNNPPKTLATKAARKTWSEEDSNVQDAVPYRDGHERPPAHAGLNRPEHIFQQASASGSSSRPVVAARKTAAVAELSSDSELSVEPQRGRLLGANHVSITRNHAVASGSAKSTSSLRPSLSLHPASRSSAQNIRRVSFALQDRSREEVVNPRHLAVKGALQGSGSSHPSDLNPRPALLAKAPRQPIVPHIPGRPSIAGQARHGPQMGAAFMPWLYGSSNLYSNLARPNAHAARNPLDHYLKPRASKSSPLTPLKLIEESNWQEKNAPRRFLRDLGRAAPRRSIASMSAPRRVPSKSGHGGRSGIGGTGRAYYLGQRAVIMTVGEDDVDDSDQDVGSRQIAPKAARKTQMGRKSSKMAGATSPPAGHSTSDSSEETDEDVDELSSDSSVAAEPPDSVAEAPESESDEDDEIYDSPSEELMTYLETLTLHAKQKRNEVEYDEKIDEYKARMKAWRCPLCELHGVFGTRSLLDAHLKWDHKTVAVIWKREGEELILSLNTSSLEGDSLVPAQHLVLPTVKAKEEGSPPASELSSNVAYSTSLPSAPSIAPPSITVSDITKESSLPASNPSLKPVYSTSPSSRGLSTTSSELSSNAAYTTTSPSASSRAPSTATSETVTATPGFDLDDSKPKSLYPPLSPVRPKGPPTS
ncbi:hypothetical protein SERLADRAFT_412912, partial [Serpula lacrymans var. lacrymans S7.9]